MKKVTIVYNPFLLSTSFIVDGKKPGENSSLDFRKQRLQEWAEKLPKILFEEYCDKNITIEFTGTLDDFMDLKEILNANSLQMSFTEFIHHRTPDVEEVEKQVIEIYEDINNGPVDALKDSNIEEAFMEAFRSEFSINVVATMSSGKSTLINSLLGTDLLPTGQMATTATIATITATPQDFYSGIAFNADGEELYREKQLSPEIVKEWNFDEKVSSMDIYGPISCVDSVGMRLVLIDTPGPNNSRDENHQLLTYNRVKESDKSLVLFVLNATQLNITDEKKFLDYVCDCMKKGGKQSRDRFIFAINKLNLYKPKDGDKVEVALESVKTGLDERDIKEPNIFPISALTAVEIRTDDDEPETIDTFRRKCSKGEEYHLEKYYEYNHLPIPSRIRLDEITKGDNAISELELHTGIPSIEEAIRLYVNKYARTIKVKDLVDSFNERLTELKAEAEIQEQIQHNKEEKARLDAEISKIQEEIDSGNSAKEYAEAIDKIDVIDNVTEEMETLIGGLQKRIDDIAIKYKGKTQMPKAEALRIVKNIQKENKDIQAQLKVLIANTFEKTFKHTYEQAINIYRERLDKLGFKSSDNGFQFNPIDFVSQEIPDIDALIKKSIQTIDEGKDETRTRIVNGARKINWFWEPWNWFTERYEKKTEYYTVHVPKDVDYVNMQKVVNEYFVPMQIDLVKLEEDVPKHLANQAIELKNNLKSELTKIEEILAKKLKDIQNKINTAQYTAAQIKEQEDQLRWMRDIISRVNKLINY